MLYIYIYTYVLIEIICATEGVYAFIFIVYKHRLRFIHGIEQLQLQQLGYDGYEVWGFEVVEGFNHPEGDASNNKDWI